ncbi:MAG TPA: sulfatase-like hydrolase/transferase [Chloroflexota bacterium]|nr:sulfatase-like hydrolase/transferase [Chloroflexota bacterium]
MAKPNILVIMSDEHDPTISTPYGHPFVRTPYQQRLADEGAVFENAYCNSPLCVPSRASFMTGRHLYRTGVWDNTVPLASDIPTWAHRLNNAGYETVLCGKMHFIGRDQIHGFSKRIMPDIHGEGGYHTNLPDWTKGQLAEPLAVSERLTEGTGAGDNVQQRYDDEATKRAVTYLLDDERHEGPWAMCVGIFAPHFPFTVRPEYYYGYYPEHADLPRTPTVPLEDSHPQTQRLRGHFQAEGITEEQTRVARAAYYGLTEFGDDKIGEILAAVDTNGLADNTIVVYTSDHGESLGEHGMWYKCTFYDPSTRVPLIVRWPGVVEPGSRHSQVTSLLDLVQTMLDVAGADNNETDGVSLAPLLRGESEDGDGEAFSEYHAHGTTTPGRMLRRGRYKLNYYLDDPPELFDLETDPDELTDLAADPAHAGRVAEMTAAILDGWDAAAIKADIIAGQQARMLINQSMGGKPYTPPWSESE